LTNDLENSLKELTKKKEELTKQAKNTEASIQTENKPKYWVVWPYSTSKGWCERITGNL
jgi:hypothetical protein